MMIGLAPGKAALCPHQKEWAKAAEKTVKELWDIFGDEALDIQHIGSTAIPSIQAKPILDIAVGVRSLSGLEEALCRLEAAGKYKKSHNRFSSDLLYLQYDEKGLRTHQIHILPIESTQWRNYVDFRDYLIRFPQKAKEYEALKEQLARNHGNCQKDYTDGKKSFMEQMLKDARNWADSERKQGVSFSSQKDF